MYRDRDHETDIIEISKWESLKENDVIIYYYDENNDNNAYTVIAKVLTNLEENHKVGTLDIHISLESAYSSKAVEIDYHDTSFVLGEVLYNEKSSLEILKENRPDLLV